MRLYEVGTNSPWSGLGDNLTPWNPVDTLPGGAYPGQKVFDQNKDEYRVIGAGSAAITAPAANGVIAQVKTVGSGASASTQTLTAAQVEDVPAGVTEIKSTLALTPDKFAGGTLLTGGVVVPVAGNSAHTIYLATELPVAIEAASVATLVVSPFANTERGAADNEKVAGVALRTIPANKIGLVKTKGPALLSVAAVGAGSNILVKASNGNAGTGDGETIGSVILAGDAALTAGVHQVYLNIA